jgi:hypothetical protein
MIRTTLGSNINSDEGVLITTPANNEALIYESSTSLWKNKTIATALGYTPIGGSGTTNFLPKWTSGSALGNSAIYDNGGNIGIGTTTASSKLYVVGDATFFNATNNVGFSLISGTSAYSTYVHFATGSLRIYSTFAGVDTISLTSAGNLLIGKTTDGGQRLQVQGNAFVSGNISANGGAGFGGDIGFGETGTSTLTFYNASWYWSIRNRATGGLEFRNITGVNALVFTLAEIRNPTTGVANGGTFSHPFTPTSGTGVFNSVAITSTINQTGGANGITRGLYVNPTLTAAADWRSIEWSNNSGWGLYGAGTAPNFLGGNTTISRNQNATTSLTVSNTTAGASSYTELILQQDASAGLGAVGKMSSISNPAGIITSSNTYLYNGTAGDIAIYNAFATGKIKFSAGAVTTPQMTLTAAGRLLLGTTTESTFLLDVNGTARVSGNLTLGGSYRVLYFGAGSNTYIVGENNDGLYLSAKKIEYSDVTTKYGRFQRVGGVTSFLIGEDGAGRAAAASSILELFSSTQGFLPPRMTNAQRTAISSPAVGLIVYCTDMVEGLYVYKSTGWTFVI